MTPTKLLIGQALAVFAIMLLGVWAATQWAASMLAFQRELGAAWFHVRGLPVYRPWALFPWWHKQSTSERGQIRKARRRAAPTGLVCNSVCSRYRAAWRSSSAIHWLQQASVD